MNDKKWTLTVHGYGAKRIYREPLTFPKLISVNNMYRWKSHNRPQRNKKKKTLKFENLNEPARLTRALTACGALFLSLCPRSTIYNQCNHRDYLELNTIGVLTETVHFSPAQKINYAVQIKRKWCVACFT